MASSRKRQINKKLLRELDDPKTLGPALDRVCEDARACRDEGALDWEEWLLEVLEVCRGLGIEESEFWRRAVSSFPDHEPFCAAFVDRILMYGRAQPADFHFLEEEAIRRAIDLPLWKLVLQEHNRQTNGSTRSSELKPVFRCVLTLGRFFPSLEESRWPDEDSSATARTFFYNLLDQCTEVILSQRTKGRGVFQILSLALQHFPEREELIVALAKNQIALEPDEERTLELCLKALMETPDDPELLRFAADRLLDMETHRAEGIEFLWRVLEFEPDDEMTELRMLKLILDRGPRDERDIRLLEKWLADGRAQDQTTVWALAAEAVAAWYADRDANSSKALEAYRSAPKESPRRGEYLRRLARSHVSTGGDWDSSLPTLEEAHNQGEGGKDVVLALAKAYADKGLCDRKSAELYAKAQDLGDDSEGLLHNLAQYLFRERATDPESQARFQRILRVLPGCAWARLGLGRGAIASQDGAAALENALILLRVSPRDLEAQAIAVEALSLDFRPPQIKALREFEQSSDLAAKTAVSILDGAMVKQPDALPLREMAGRLRWRLGMADERTERLLANTCKAKQDDLRLRLQWADCLQKMERLNEASQLYRAILHADSARRNGNGITAAERDRVLRRWLQAVIAGEITIEKADEALFVEAALSPKIEPDLLARIVGELVLFSRNHPQRAMVLERLRVCAPDDERVDVEIALAQVKNGHVMNAIRTGVAFLRQGKPVQGLRLLEEVLVCSRGKRIAGGDLIRSLALGVRHKEVGLPEPGRAVLAQLLLRSGAIQKEDAQLFEDLCAAEPNNDELAFGFAQCLEELGDFTRAALVLRRLRSSDSFGKEATLALARLHQKMGRREETALDVAIAANEAEPDDPELAIHCAAACLRAHQLDKAADALAPLLTDKPPKATARAVLEILEEDALLALSHPRLGLLFAKACMITGCHHEALEALSRLRTWAPAHCSAMSEIYDGVLTHMEDDPWAIAERGRFWVAARYPGKGIPDLEESLRKKPTPEATKSLVTALEAWIQEVNDPDTEPQWITRLFRLAKLYLEAGHEERAIAPLRGLLVADHDHSEARLMLAQIYLNSNRADEMRAVLDELEDSERKCDLLQKLAETYAENHRYGEAAETLTSLISITKEHTPLLRRLRDIYRGKALEDESDTNIPLEPTTDSNIILTPQTRTRYELRRLIGRGAMGEVYLAQDHELDEIVVLKLLSEQALEDPDALERFRCEARSARRLSHPNIVRIHDIGWDAGQPHISMEFLQGGDLMRRLSKVPGRLLPEEVAVDIVRQVSRALSHAHGEGILHLDVKPGNILLASKDPAAMGRVKLSDFGISAIIDRSNHIVASDLDSTAGRPHAGTPIYMSPEQFDGRPTTIASDIYSLGVLFYELLCGEPPFAKGSVAYHHRYTEAPELPHHVSKTLRSIVRRCLLKDPAERFASVGELLGELDHYDGHRRRRAG
ncbi:MAG: protein kinase [Sumerlaeia bacterium]